MTQENKRWEIYCGDIGNFNISDAQMQMIKRAESSGARFVDIGEALINISFIRGAVSFYDRPALPSPERKELTEEQRIANLEKLKELRANLIDKGVVKNG